MKKAAKKMTKSENRDQYTIVLEDLRSHFRAFGENLSIVRDRVGKIDDSLIRIEQDIVTMRLQIARLEERVAKIGQNEWKLLESRIGKLEKLVR